ncbi:MAG: DEAD/DEAH box helicase [Opitutales bacterium]
MEGIATSLKLPDIWQQQAARHLREGRDVVVHAPTGAGKTFIFETLVASGQLRGQAVYTVPTRALANDKLYEWRARGWNVGIATGDLAENLDAPVIVATLETQKSRLLRGEGPDLLVIDEYQMLGDAVRGGNYELAVAMAPAPTQLLLLSGSVANPERAVNWLKRIGRDAVLVDHAERPVPQDEIFAEALRQNIPPGIRGFWPQMVAKALQAGFGPVLLFAPRRKAAEELARHLAGALPHPDPLELTPEQKSLVGDSLAKLLRQRVAYHHSGLSYHQRAGLIEPLAKSGQLQIVVATTGLAAGINFCMRAVLVTDREYQRGSHKVQVRPDELLQMFGRAGRRGLDEIGYVLVAPGKPRLNEARPLKLKRVEHLDWPSYLAVMREARRSGRSPLEAAHRLHGRLFTNHPPELGFERLSELEAAEGVPAPPGNARFNRMVEMLNARQEWERQRPRTKVRLGQAWIYADEQWYPALSLPQSLKSIEQGNLCRLKSGKRKIYGREVPVATLADDPKRGEVLLVKWLLKALRERAQQRKEPTRGIRRGCTLIDLEMQILPLMPELLNGGKVVRFQEKNGLFSVRLDFSEAWVLARVDSCGQALINAPRRETECAPFPSFAEIAGNATVFDSRTPAENWRYLGLIDRHGVPTRRGEIFSFFNHGEGLAVAAALEDTTYPVDELAWDLANLRAGHRFQDYENSSGRLASICRMTYRGATLSGYLVHGVPTEYGNGASEILRLIRDNPATRHQLITENLRAGDIERAFLEWRSLLNHIAGAPGLDWERWTQLQGQARQHLEALPQSPSPQSLPELTFSQRLRYQPKYTRITR